MSCSRLGLGSKGRGSLGPRVGSQVGGLELFYNNHNKDNTNMITVTKGAPAFSLARSKEINSFPHPMEQENVFLSHTHRMETNV